MDYTKMDELILSWREEILATLKPWIAIDSVQTPPTADNAPFGDAVRAMLDRFLADAAKLGFATDDVDGYAGSAQMGAGERTMGILAHLDIVPAGDGWVHDAFGGEIEDGKMYGRGTNDDKGPALAALYAMRAVREAGVPLKDGVRLIVGCDEETGMSDMRYYAQHRKMPDYGFSPDAMYPLINIEKGGLAIQISKVTGSEDGARIPVYALNAGIRRNVVPGVATAEVGCKDADALNAALAAICARHEHFNVRATALDANRAKIEAVGVSSHASRPEQGVNAAGMLLIALKELGAGGDAKAAIAALADLLGMDSTGAQLGIACSDELSGALTCNLGLLRFDGRYLHVTLDIRYPLCADETIMLGQAAMACKDAGLAITNVGGHTPLHVPAESEIVQGLLAVYHEVTGLPAYAMAIGGGTYSRTMPNTVAFGISFPGDIDTAHMPEECLDIDKFMLSIKIMAHAIARLAGK